MRVANYRDVSELNPYNTPRGWYWARDANGAWIVVVVYHHAKLEGGILTRVYSPGRRVTGMIDMGPRIEPPT